MIFLIAGIFGILIALTFVGVYIAAYKIRPYVRETRRIIEEAKAEETDEEKKGGNRKW